LPASQQVLPFLNVSVRLSEQQEHAQQMFRQCELQYDSTYMLPWVVHCSPFSCTWTPSGWLYLTSLHEALEYLHKHPGTQAEKGQQELPAAACTDTLQQSRAEPSLQHCHCQQLGLAGREQARSHVVAPHAMPIHGTRPQITCNSGYRQLLV
jgi:hypothetical protein